MVGSDEPGGSAGGRHGGDSDTGLSVAELIARSRAASPAAPARPSRSSRRAAPASNLAEPARLVVSSEANAVNELIRQAASPATVPIRHLSVVEASPDELPSVRELQPPPAPRGGRNLPAAIGVGVALGALIIATLTVYRPSFAFVVAIAVAIGVIEIVTAIGTVEARPSLVPLLAGTAAMEAAAWFRGPDGLVGALLLTALGLTIWRLADGAAGYLRDVAAGQLVALYVPFLAGFAVLMVHADDGAARIIIFILTVVCSDTGGYAAGVVLGKHPMAPTVSPKKSWEGLAGSLLAGSVSGLLMMTLCFHHHWWQGVLFGIAVVITATLGDLGESMIKRDLGLKDMGKLLPGHGGIMDRLDSLLPCAPVAYLLLAAFLR
ncbi:MAG: phosphatidate cytidylyltransferase [Jatrophihabitantaceae bacterium]